MKTRLMGWVAVAALGGVSLMGCEKPAEQEAPVEEKATAEVAVSEPVEIVVYSSRKEHLIKPLFDKYTAETGTKISYITDKEGPLMARLEAEGERTPADIFITVDAGICGKRPIAICFRRLIPPY